MVLADYDERLCRQGGVAAPRRRRYRRIKRDMKVFRAGALSLLTPHGWLLPENTECDAADDISFRRKSP